MQRFRNWVSTKGRSQGQECDLDLTYVTPRVIAMSFPSLGKDSHRNPVADVERFFEEKHPGRYRVYNLCAEREYDRPTRFDGSFQRFPFRVHHAPVPFSLIPDFVKDAAGFLAEHPSNVVAVHCVAGKGRAGVMVSALLLALGDAQTASEALALFAAARADDSPAVCTPSQRRYLVFYDRARHKQTTQWMRLLHLSTVTVSDIGATDKGDRSCKGMYLLVDEGPHAVGGSAQRLFDSRAAQADAAGVKRESAPGSGVTERVYEFASPLVVRGDVLFQVKGRRRIGADEDLFRFWLNTAFCGPRVVLPKSELDDACTDTRHTRFRPGLSVTLSFSPLPGRDKPRPRRRSLEVRPVEVPPPPEAAAPPEPQEMPPPAIATPSASSAPPQSEPTPLSAVSPASAAEASERFRRLRDRVRMEAEERERQRLAAELTAGAEETRQRARMHFREAAPRLVLHEGNCRGGLRLAEMAARPVLTSPQRASPLLSPRRFDSPGAWMPSSPRRHSPREWSPASPRLSPHQSFRNPNRKPSSAPSRRPYPADLAGAPCEARQARKSLVAAITPAPAERRTAPRTLPPPDHSIPTDLPDASARRRLKESQPLSGSTLRWAADLRSQEPLPQRVHVRRQYDGYDPFETDTESGEEYTDSAEETSLPCTPPDPEEQARKAAVMIAAHVRRDRAAAEAAAAAAAAAELRSKAQRYFDHRSRSLAAGEAAGRLRCLLLESTFRAATVSTERAHRPAPRRFLSPLPPEHVWGATTPLPPRADTDGHWAAAEFVPDPAGAADADESPKLPAATPPKRPVADSIGVAHAAAGKALDCSPMYAALGGLEDVLRSGEAGTWTAAAAATALQAARRLCLSQDEASDRGGIAWVGR